MELNHIGYLTGHCWLPHSNNMNRSRKMEKSLCFEPESTLKTKSTETNRNKVIAGNEKHNVVDRTPTKWPVVLGRRAFRFAL